jgi:DNA polymerase-3 subunit chi
MADTATTEVSGEVWFYHLTQWPLERALPPLIEKTLERGWRALVRAGTPERLEILNEHLWSWSEGSFLPHGLVGEDRAASQPVLLTTEMNNDNGADVLFVVDGAEAGELSSFTRTILIFDGNNDDALVSAREEWRRAKENDMQVSYWQQSETGGFEKKA